MNGKHRDLIGEEAADTEAKHLPNDASFAEMNASYPYHEYCLGIPSNVTPQKLLFI